MVTIKNKQRNNSVQLSNSFVHKNLFIAHTRCAKSENRITLQNL